METIGDVETEFGTSLKDWWAATLPAVVPSRYRFGDHVVSFLSTLAHFAGAEDLFLSELRIEPLFPADEESRALLLSPTES